MHSPRPRHLSSLLAVLAVIALSHPAVGGPVAEDRPPAGLSLPWVFADHMVLQREMPVPVWGMAEPGAQINVSFGAMTVSTTAGESGLWSLQLAAQAAESRGRPLIVTADQMRVRFEDVVVGEVWLCAGQSNMDFPLRRATGGEQAAAAKGPYALRLCDRTGSPGGARRRLEPAELERITPERFYAGTWNTETPDSAASFSAVGFHSGRELASALGVTVGLIDVSVGGSSTEGWVPRECLRGDPLLAPLAEDFLASPLSHPFIRDRTTFQLGDWVDAGRPDPRPRHFFEPGFLYQAAIQPLAPYAIRGVLWYQGESNAHLPQVADRLFRQLVDRWRQTWDRPDLPFCFAQLPGMSRPTWPRFREVQAGWQDIPDVSMAVTIDVGHPTDVHPQNKRPVGERLARVALAGAYGRDHAHAGPQFRSARRAGDRLEVSFAHAEGLAWAEGRGPTGFEVAGEDRRFYAALAEIREERVVLWSPEVDRPRDVRYAWAPYPEWSLVNAAGLPAAPFRSQDWKPTRIACVGDSITAGHGLAEPATESYPARLQGLLGDGFEVRNFGRSGAGVVLSTMRGNWPRAFRRNPEHQNALLFEPDVVVCNLGINDIMAWGSTGDSFVEDYLALIGDYRQLVTRPTILLWGPLAPLFPGQTYHGSPHEAEIHRAIERVARRARAETIDLHAPLHEHPAWFPDHIHPDARGAEAIAGEVRAALVEHSVVPPDPRPLRLYVLTGQSNSLGTTADPEEDDPGPGSHDTDAAIRFFWSNRSTRAGDGPAVLIGDSGGRVTSLQVQQGEGASASFWGPEYGFGRALHEAGERHFVIVKASRGGGGNRFWSKGSGDDHMYRHVVDTVEAAVAALSRGTEVEVAALLYLQGESDSAAEAAGSGQRLKKLASNLRRDLPSAKQMRVLVAGIAAGGPHRDRVREEQRQVAEQDPRMIYFTTLDLQDHLHDGLHFDRSAKLLVGQRFARAWEAIGGAPAFRTAGR